MNYKITHIIGALRWKVAMLVVLLVVGGQSVWGQYYRFEYLGDCPCFYGITVIGTSGSQIQVYGSYNVLDGGVRAVLICGNDYYTISDLSSRVTRSDGGCWTVPGLFKVYPVITYILDNPVTGYLPTFDKVTIKSKYPNFPERLPSDKSLMWDFSFDQDTWFPFPHSYQNTVSNSISASELFSESGFLVNDYINKYVYVRARYDCPFKDNIVSNPIQYKIVASPPNITKIDTIAPKCSTDNGAAKISIDRNLSPGEVLMLDVYNDGELTKVPLNSSKISFSTPYSLSLYPGNYYITYQSQFTRSDGTFYNSDPITTSPFTIRTINAVTFTATLTNISCIGNEDGKITLSATGGTGSGYQYNIAPSLEWTGFSNSTTPQITGRPKGSYTLKVKDSNGCESATAVVEIKEPDPLTITLQNQNNASKSGSADGSISVTAGGGTPPYNYVWRDETGNPISVTTNLRAGTYTLTLTDSNYPTASPNTGCAITNSFTIKQPDELVISSVSKPNDCNGKADGKIVVTATGGAPIGAPTYTYKWSKKNDAGIFVDLSGETANSISNREGGTYKVTVTDANNNSVDKEIPLIDPDPISITGNVTNIPCADGVSRGGITVDATGGTGTLSYSWDDDTNETSRTRSNLVAKAYTVTVTDANRCTAVQKFTVQSPLSLPTVSFTYSKNPTTYGGNDGVLAISSSGGTGNYSYIWTKDGQSFNPKSLDSLYAGNYSVTITDANHCQSSPATATLTNPVPPIILSNTKTDVTCYCGNNGTITANITRDHFTDEVITYTYSWYKLNTQSGIYETVAKSEESSVNSNTKLTAGKYKIVVTDNYNASSSIITDLTEIYTQIVPALKATDVSCFGSGDGKVEVTGITGGIGPYTCKWSNNAEGLVATNLSPGSYYVTITDDAGCTAKSSPVQVIQHDPLTVTLTGHDPDGYGRGNGSITAEVGGGNGGNEYVWTGTDITGADFTSTATAVSGLKAGTYSLTVKDKNGCSATASVHIDQPNPLIVNIEEVHPVSCHDGSDGTLKATASGGVKQAGGTYTYTWKKINADNTYSPISSGTSDCLSVSGSAGGYMVEVEDAHKNELKSANTITLINPEPLAISTQSITDVNCYNDSTGQIHFTVTGGTGSYTYLNNDGDTISNDLTGLHAGKYMVKIKDAYCELDHEFTVSQPSAPLSVTLARTELSAYHAVDAKLVATVSGGTFSPDKPCDFDWTGSDSKTKTASGLASGTYKLTVTDNNGCTAEASATFIDPLKVDIVVTDTIRCNGGLGQLAARAVGGEPNPTGLPYKYTWYKHDIKTGTSTLLYPLDDLKPSDDSVKTLPEGHYSVEIDDNHGRILQTAPFHLTQPDTIKFRVDSMNVSCKGENNGFIRVTTTGGSGLYKYLWNNGSRSNERTNLPPGNYTVEVSDSLFDCAAVPASRTITITEPDKLALSLQKRDVLVACDGKIEAIVTGGTRPYRFRWNDGEETVDSVKTLLCDGNYNVEIIDKNGCTATASILLPPPLVVKISVQDSVKCFGDNNGSLVVHAQGGVPYKTGKPYKYSWKKQNASGMYEELTAGKDSVVAGLTAGWYALNIIDSIGVTLRADSVFYLPQPEALAIRIQKTDVLCHGASTGAISAVVTGGLKPYRLLWNTGSTDAELQNIKAGVYTITATDRNGCTKQYTASIDQSDSLIIGFTNTVAPLSAGSCDGLLTASVLGGVGPYTYQWSPNNIVGATADKLCRGSYTVTVNDMFGCPAQVTKNLNDAPPPFVVSLYVKDSISCHGTATGAIAARVSGGIPFTTGNPYTYIWKKKNSVGEYRSIANGSDSIVGNLTSGWYAFNVQDSDKNILSESIEIYLSEPDTLALTVSHTDIPCKDLHNGSAAVVASGGVLPYAYKWSNGETSTSIDNLAPGEYWIEVTDKHGCISRQSVTVTEPELLSVTFQPKLISEYNVCDGSLKAVVRGGTAPFSYAWSGVNSTADTVSSLCAGAYSVTVTDAHGCSDNQKITLSNPPALRLSLVVQDSIKCNGNVQGVLVATAQGGIPFASGEKYRYTWKKKNSRGVFETIPAYTDSMATDLATGTYACTITDANGISLHKDSVILLPEPTELQLAIQQTNIGCSGADEGSATVIPSGGSLPYAYAWSTGDKTATVRNLSAGSYIVRVTDRNGCVAARQIYISKAAPLYLFLYKKQPVCYQSCDGEIKTTVSGGIAPYSFRWTGSASTGSEAGSLCAGKYSLLVTDAVGCTIQKNDSLQNPAQLALDLGADRYICSGQTIRYNITIPAKTGISYSWAGPDGFTATTPTVDLTKPGTYTASVTNAAGCSNSGSVMLTPSGTTVANEFALPTQAFVNEKIVIVNTTYPAPDSIRWVLPATAQILSGGQSYTEFQVADTGVYVIKMISYKGVCSSELEKEMIVSARSQLSDIGNAKTPFIQTFSVTPNPSHGELASKIVLQDKADVQLKLINVLSNQVVFQGRKSGDSTYEVAINVTVLPGVYLLLLETPKGSATMKVIIF